MQTTSSSAPITSDAIMVTIECALAARASPPSFKRSSFPRAALISRTERPALSRSWYIVRSRSSVTPGSGAQATALAPPDTSTSSRSLGFVAAACSRIAAPAATLTAFGRGWPATNSRTFAEHLAVSRDRSVPADANARAAQRPPRRCQAASAEPRRKAWAMRSFRARPRTRDPSGVLPVQRRWVAQGRARRERSGRPGGASLPHQRARTSPRFTIVRPTIPSVNCTMSGVCAPSASHGSE